MPVGKGNQFELKFYVNRMYLSQVKVKFYAKAFILFSII